MCIMNIIIIILILILIIIIGAAPTIGAAPMAWASRGASPGIVGYIALAYNTSYNII